MSSSSLEPTPFASSLTARASLSSSGAFQTAYNSRRLTTSTAIGRVLTTTRSRITATATATRDVATSSSKGGGISNGAIIAIGVVAGLAIFFGTMIGAVACSLRRRKGAVERDFDRRRKEGQFPPVTSNLAAIRYVTPAAVYQPAQCDHSTTRSSAAPSTFVSSMPLPTRTAEPAPGEADDRMERGDLFPPPPYEGSKEGGGGRG